MLLAGCGDTDCYIVSRDAKGIKAKAPVVWQDAYVGAVSEVAEDPQGTKIALGIKSEFAEKIHAGVAARIVLDDKISAAPFVLLVGGNNTEMPILAGGAQIPEAAATAEIKNGFDGFIQWAKNSSHTAEKTGGGLLVILLVILRFVKKMVKMLIKLLILVVIVLTILITKQDWSAYRERFSAAFESFQSAQSWVSEHSESLKKIVQEAIPSDGR